MWAVGGEVGEILGWVGSGDCCLISRLENSGGGDTREGEGEGERERERGDIT